MENYNFSGWATRNDIRCSDGRTIRKDAFKHCDGLTVPLVWGHKHDDPLRVLGHAVLENREEGVYTYGFFNDTEQGLNAKELVEHGDVVALSIYANQLKQHGGDVLHGAIREVSLVLAGANPGALIENVVRHGEDDEEIVIEDEGFIYTGENIVISHADKEEKEEEKTEDKKEDAEKPAEEKKTKTVAEVFKTLNEEQEEAVYTVINALIDDGNTDETNKEDKENKKTEKSEGGETTMKHNVFDNQSTENKTTLTHEDKEAIVALSKQPGVGSLQAAISMYVSQNEKLAHAFDQEDETTVGLLFPEPKLINPGAPELIRDYDQSWVMKVINKIHKSPFSKIRTRKADARATELRAKGYQKKGDEKTIMNKIKLLSRTTEPQTVYVKDELHRDDIIDIDFDVVNYQWNIMKETMYETLALAALIGDGREDGDPDKIREGNIRPIWTDEEFYTMHVDVDIAKAKQELQGTETGANFGENYIYAEAIITAALYSREKFKGTGLPSLYCTPHLVNVMLLARDLNGRRIYDSKADLAKALNVAEIVEIEQLEEKTRTTADSKTKKLLGLFVNLADYTFGSAKGGELTKFEDFDIDYNKYKYLMETRLSGSLTEPASAIALEEPVTE